MFSRISMVAFFVLFVFGQTAESQVTSLWNGGTGDWSLASNWSTANYPNNGNAGSNYDVQINSGNVMMDVGVAIESLVLNSAILNSNGFDMSINNFSAWNGGSLTGDGETHFAGGVDFAGSSKTLSNNHVVNNSAASTWSSGSFNSGTGSVLNNLAGATIVNNFDGSFNYNLGGVESVINNSGVFTKNAGTGTTNITTVFNNTGQVTSSSGTLRLARGGSHTGLFDADGNGILEFGGSQTHDFLAGSVVVGTGEIAFTGGTSNLNMGVYDLAGDTRIAGGTVNFETAAQTDDLSLTAGTRGGNGVLNVSGTMTWNGGTLTGMGTTNANATMELGGSTRWLSGDHTINNSGQANWTAGGFNTGGGSTFNNLPSSTFTTNFDGGFSYNLGGAESLFRNEGTFAKNGGTGTTNFTVPFDNSGVVNVTSGTLRLGRGGTSSGLFDTGVGGTLEFGGGTHELVQGSMIGGFGDVVFTGGTANLNTDQYDLDGVTRISGATVNFDSFTQTSELIISSGTKAGNGTTDVSGPMEWTGGMISGPGMTNSNGTLVLSGSSKWLNSDHQFNNFGSATWTDGNFNTGFGAVFNNMPAATFITGYDGSFSYNLGGPDSIFNNQGDFIRNGGTGTTNFSCQFNNEGSVSVSDGTLRLTRGGTGTGEFLQGPNGTLEFAGSTPYDLVAGSTVLGGTVAFTQGSAVINSDQFDVADTSISGGTMQLKVNGETDDCTLQSGVRNGAGTFTIQNTFDWLGGTLTENGETHVNGLTNIQSGTRFLSDNHHFKNSGSVQWSGGTINSGTGAVFENQPNALVELLNDVDFNFNFGGTPTLFNNRGDFIKSDGPGLSTFSTEFTNSGTMKVDAGTLLLTRGMTQTAGLLSLNGGDLTANQSLDVLGGAMIGEATITAPDTCFNGATLSPGFAGSSNTFGLFNFTGDLKLVNNAVVEFEISSLSGVAGDAWDFIDVNGELQLSDPVLPSALTVKVISRDANGNSAPLAGFDSSAQFSVAIAAADTVAGFDPSLVTVDLSEFSNPVSGSFSLATVSNGGRTALELVYNGILKGDVNNDGVVNLLDVSPFVAAISSGTYVAAADTNCDGQVNLLDVAEFVSILSN